MLITGSRSLMGQPYLGFFKPGSASREDLVSLKINYNTVEIVFCVHVIDFAFFILP